MKTLLQILSGTLLSISAITAVNHLLVDSFGGLVHRSMLEKFTEKLINFQLSPRGKMIAAWLVLYCCIALFFLFSYDLLFNQSAAFSWDMALIFGVGSAIVAMLGWMIIFDVPFKKVNVAFASYFVLLFFAHILFGVGVVAAYKNVILG